MRSAGAGHAMSGERDATLRRVADLMRASILSGELPPLLPPESELQRAFSASRNVIREALSWLRAEGLVERQQGTGTFVVGRRFAHRVDRLGSFDPSGAGVGVHREPMAVQIIPMPAIVAATLGVHDQDRCVMIERVTIAEAGKLGEEEPTSLWTSYLPWDLRGVMTELDSRRALHAVIADVAGSEVDEVRFTINAAVATEPVAASLDVAVGAPVIRQQRLAILKDGRAAEWALGWSRGDRLTFQSVRRS